MFTLLLSSLIGLPAQTNFHLVAGQDPAEDHWVDSVFNALSEDERLGQLFMIRAHSDLGPDHIQQVKNQIRKYKVGSLCFFQGTPQKQIELINEYQALSSTLPLMIAVDAEWGIGMRFKESAMSFPRQLMLGAIQDNDLLYEMGREVGRQLKRTGVHVNFAPVVDVNNNAANPVINTRSFGEDRYNVTIKSYKYMKGMQDEGVMACAKHFPGHGDTDVDSHLDLPVIRHDRGRLDSIELYPFRVLGQEGVGSMMIAHLNVPALDNRPNRPTSLSRSTVTGMLREEYGFEGLVFTDALEMKGVTKYFEPGEVEAESLLAGNDILCLPEDIDASMQAIKRYLAEGKLSQAELDASVRRVLRSKYRLGLTGYEPILQHNLHQELHNAEAMALKRKLIQEALTLVRNQDNLIPFTGAEQHRMASLSIGAGGPTPFQERIADYEDMDHFQMPMEASAEQRQSLLQTLSGQEIVIVGLHNMSQYARNNFGLNQSTLDFLYQLNQQTKVVLCVFGNPYSLKYFDRFEWVLCSYNDEELTQDLSAQALFGANAFRGRLPVTASRRSVYNAGHITAGGLRMGFSLPEETGMNSDTLHKIDEIIREAIAEKAMPGCVVLVAKDGKIVFEKAYGHHTYAKAKSVNHKDVYDLASITKIAATTLSVIKLHENGKIDIAKPINHYLPELNESNKSGKVIEDIMAHHAGLIGWIPFYEQTLAGSRRNPRPSNTFYRSSLIGNYSIEVAKNLYLREDFRDSIWQQIYDSDLRRTDGYRYSDLGFYLLSQVVERSSGLPINEFAKRHFYQPLGLRSTDYLPLETLTSHRIVPSEKDNYFRKTEIRGYVHDMGAAMLGGVSGHAGLFSNARELAILMEMLLREGNYGGQQLLDARTVRRFTRRHPKSTRRGIGFDMLELDESRPPNLAVEASRETFGHLGFTGTAVWSDPAHHLTFIFLSNRTYPSMKNNKLYELNTRPRVQSVVYRAMGIRGQTRTTE